MSAISRRALFGLSAGAAAAYAVPGPAREVYAETVRIFKFSNMIEADLLWGRIRSIYDSSDFSGMERCHERDD